MRGAREALDGEIDLRVGLGGACEERALDDLDLRFDRAPLGDAFAEVIVPRQLHERQPRVGDLRERHAEERAAGTEADAEERRRA